MSDPEQEDDANGTESEAIEREEEPETDERDESDESETEEIEHEQIVTREDGAAVLRQLADAVAEGSVTLETGDEPITTTVPDRFELELEYEADDEEAELEAELEWPLRDGEAVSADEADADEDEDEDEDGEETVTEGEAAEADEDREEAEDAETEDDEEAADEIPITDVVGASTATSNARFELYRDRADEWRWRLVHDNGNIIADSGEGYTRKTAARNGLESVMRNAPGADVVDETD